MKPITGQDITEIEARARALRAAALRDGAIALKRWIASRVASLRSAATGPRHG